MADKRDAKILLSVIRKIMPSIIARQLAGVQPMQGPVGSVHSLRSRLRSPWTPWEKRFSWKPKRSINGKLVLGYLNVSLAWVCDQDGNESDTEYRWATNKEVFLLKLKGNDD